jgi:hypothetical protein
VSTGFFYVYVIGVTMKRLLMERFRHQGCVFVLK